MELALLVGSDILLTIRAGVGREVALDVTEQDSQDRDGTGYDGSVRFGMDPNT